MKRVMAAWCQAHEAKLREDLEVYLVNKVFQLLRRNQKQEENLVKRVSADLRRQLLLRKYFRSLKRHREQSVNTRLADMYRRKVVLRHWRRVMQVIRMMEVKLRMIKEFLDKKQRFRLLPKYFCLLRRHTQRAIEAKYFNQKQWSKAVWFYDHFHSVLLLTVSWHTLKQAAQKNRGARLRAHLLKRKVLQALRQEIDLWKMTKLAAAS